MTFGRYRNCSGTRTDVSTTMIYTHALNKGGRGIANRLDSGGSGKSPVAQDVAVGNRATRSHRRTSPPVRFAFYSCSSFLGALDVSAI